jgi:DNA-binding transcriptional MocR family regulator
MGVETALAAEKLSRYGKLSITPSPVNRMMAEFDQDFRDGVDVNLGVGYVNEHTIPTRRFQEALEAVAADPARYRQAFNYGGPAGTANLIESIKGLLAGRGLDPELLRRKRLIVGPCGATSVLESLAEVMEKGIVITSDPMYYIYCEALERKGFEVVAVPEDREGIELEALDRKLSALGDRLAEISFFYAVTVNNPSCTLLSNRRRRDLAHAAARVSEKLGRRVPIFFDQAYELLLHDPDAAPFESALPYDELGIVYEVGTLSKILAPSLRIGYLLGPDGVLMDAMVQKTSDAGFSAPVFAQEMASWLLDHHVEEQLRLVNAGYRAKAVAVKNGLEQSLGDHLAEYRGGSAGFYFYLTFKDVETHGESKLFRRLTRKTGDPEIDGRGEVRPRVFYIPGEHCVHPRGDLVDVGRRQMRLSYGYEETPRILDALRLMKQEIERQ